jgi:hypothetical protein
MKLHPDFRDFLAALDREGVEYLVVGGYAVGFHSRPRFTKDIDVLVSVSRDNRARLVRALTSFGAPDAVIEGAKSPKADEVLWMGRPPTRIDILKSIEAVEFDEAYARRVVADWEGVPVHLLALDDLIANKRAVGRDQDRLDVKSLEQVRARKRK